MLVVRNAYLGARRFDGFQSALGLMRHVLAQRLARLAGAGVLRNVAYQERPRRYENRLSEMGASSIRPRSL